MENLKNILGKRIREERSKKGWSIEKLAEMIDLSPSSLGLVERADRALSIEKLFLVAQALNVPVDSLLKFENTAINDRLQTLKLFIENLNDSDFNYIADMIRLSSQHLKNK